MEFGILVEAVLRSPFVVAIDCDLLMGFGFALGRSLEDVKSLGALSADLLSPLFLVGNGCLSDWVRPIRVGGGIEVSCGFVAILDLGVGMLEDCDFMTDPVRVRPKVRASDCERPVIVELV